MAELKAVQSEGNLSDANSEADMFKSLSDVSINLQPQQSIAKGYKPSPLAVKQLK